MGNKKSVPLRKKDDQLIRCSIFIVDEKLSYAVERLRHLENNPYSPSFVTTARIPNVFQRELPNGKKIRACVTILQTDERVQEGDFIVGFQHQPSSWKNSWNISEFLSENQRSVEFLENHPQEFQDALFSIVSRYHSS